MKKKEAIEMPYVVKSHDIHIDADYAKWIANVKHRYRSAQIKAAVRVNNEFNNSPTTYWRIQSTSK